MTPETRRSKALSIDFYLQPALSADLRFKTMNGEVFTDFEVEPIVLANAEPRRRGDRFVYRSHGAFGARTGGGGAALSFETLNGDIYLRRDRPTR